MNPMQAVNVTVSQSDVRYVSQKLAEWPLKSSPTENVVWGRNSYFYMGFKIVSYGSLTYIPKRYRMVCCSCAGMLPEYVLQKTLLFTLDNVFLMAVCNCVYFSDFQVHALVCYQSTYFKRCYFSLLTLFFWCSHVAACISRTSKFIRWYVTRVYTSKDVTFHTWHCFSDGRLQLREFLGFPRLGLGIVNITSMPRLC